MDEFIRLVMGLGDGEALWLIRVLGWLRLMGYFFVILPFFLSFSLPLSACPYLSSGALSTW